MTYYQSQSRSRTSRSSPTAIDHVEPRGVVTADGTVHELDLLVLATGFDARAYVRPMDVTGEDGMTPRRGVAGRAEGLPSVAVPGFPNMFMMMGPHSPIGNQSLIPVAEDQADYALWWIKQIAEGSVISAAPTELCHQGLQRSDESGHAADHLGERLLELVPRQGRPPRTLPWTPRASLTTCCEHPELRDFEVRTSR